MLAQQYRFHGHKSLQYVYKNGQTVRSRLYTIKLTSNSHRTTSRLAVVVSKKIHKRAVHRNRVRRRIYERVRPLIVNSKKAYDVAIIVSSAELRQASGEQLAELAQQLQKLMK